MLVHLAGGQPQRTSHLSATTPIGVEGVWWNTALSGPNGVLGAQIDLKREILESSGANALTGDAMIKVRYGLYHGGRRHTRLGPPLDDAESI
jgi:hypothetical protein